MKQNQTSSSLAGHLLIACNSYLEPTSKPLPFKLHIHQHQTHWFGTPLGHMWDMSLGGSPGPPQDEDFRMKLGGLVVVASNAGGAWTPIGDITTTMLYIGGQALLKEVHPNDEKQQGKAESEQNGEHM